jgi:N-methylhydantoinase B
MDGIDLEVIFQSTLQIARELTMNMLRTGYSTVIKESQDFTFAIFDRHARMVAQGIPQPAHIGPIAAQVREIHRVFRGKMNPGDSFIVNHPYRACQNHATDVTIISPVFFEGQLVAYIGNTAHKPDIGGKVPGTNSPDATEVFQEGLLIPPVKLYREGVLIEELYELICANTRTPEVTWGDINAQVQTNVYGIRKFGELFGKYGTESVLKCWTRWMDICEEELINQIRQLPPGKYGPAVDYLDDDGIDREKSYRISLSLEVRKDSLHFTLDSDPQARGPINLRPCVSRNVIECWVKMAFAPHLPVNDGMSRPIEVAYPPEGSLLNPRFPAPVNMYVRASQLISTLVARVLGEVAPGRIPAPGSGGSGGLTGSGRNPRTGRWFSMHEIYNGGGGARPHGDGVSVQDELVLNVMNTPVEAVETEFPLRIRRYELIQDSAGAGRYRGGLGALREWEVLSEEVTFNLRADRFKFSSPGSLGASPAQPSSATLNPGGDNERSLPSKVAGLRLGAGDVLSWGLAGGGGRGDPRARDVEQVRQDVLCGYVSIEAAQSLYGVVLSPAELTVDEKATAKLREGAHAPEGGKR